MALEIVNDARVRAVEWRDLLALSPLEVAHELLIPLPWLVGSLWLASLELWPLALAASFMFFLCGLRQGHNAFHRAVGLPRLADELLLGVLSLLMLGSMHAVRFNHLRHHRDCMGEGDVEASSARYPAWKALLTGPLFPLRLHTCAWRLGDRRLLSWLCLEVGAGLGLVWLAVLVPELLALRYHVAAMVLGQSLAGFFAVWTVHHDCERSHFIARTIRRPMLSRLSYHMFFHVEHHLFPAVPTCRLPRLAERLDRVAPELASRQVF